MSKKILVRGPLLSESGYGNHARQVFRWLLSRHQDAEISVQILPWGSTSWYVNPAAEGGLVGEIMKRSVEPNQKFDVSFQIQLPNEWSADLAHKNIGVTAVVESDKCNPEWIKCCNAMTAVVVPSSFCEKTLRSSGEVTSPIIVIPESFILSNSEIAALYRHPTVKALVAPTRGEGFGLPILEAAASGLPVIATEQSGHMDFMGKGKFVRLEYDMSPIHQTRVDNNIWMAGTKWAEVRESDFKKKVRKFKSSPDNPKQWALDLSKILIETHSPRAIDEFYEISIGEILK